MPVDQKRTQTLFRKLSQMARKLTSDPRPEYVHQFRTTTRRIETLFDELVPSPGRNERKLLKQLGKIRKRAGRVRDLDVQMAALRNLKIGHDGQEKRILLGALAADRGRMERKLLSLLDKDSLRGLRKRLRRASKEPRLHGSRLDPVAKALRTFSRLAQRQPEVNEAALHQYRLSCKRIRYIAEMAGREPRAEAMVEQLKAIQDAIGEWHDWDTLTGRAVAVFSNLPNAPLVTAVSAVRHSKLTEALRVTRAARAALLNMQEQAVPGRKPIKSAVSPAREGSAFASAAIA